MKGKGTCLSRGLPGGGGGGGSEREKVHTSGVVFQRANKGQLNGVQVRGQPDARKEATVGDREHCHHGPCSPCAKGMRALVHPTLTRTLLSPS